MTALERELSPTLGALHSGTLHLPPVGLEEVLAIACLQTRIDRKYLLAPGVFTGLMTRLGRRMHALQIGELRCFRYDSVYFDTETLLAYHQAAYGRRRRFKVRTRTYVDAGECVLEIKTEGGREETVKDRLAYDAESRALLTKEGREFVAARVCLPDGGRELVPTLVTDYQRCTLVDLVDGARVTCDAGLVCHDDAGRGVVLGDHVLVETKSAGALTAVDRILWEQGIRPMPISKYCVGMALLYPWLPAHKWNRVLRQNFGWTPGRGISTDEHPRPALPRPTHHGSPTPLHVA